MDRQSGGKPGGGRLSRWILRLVLIVLALAAIADCLPQQFVLEDLDPSLRPTPPPELASLETTVGAWRAAPPDARKAYAQWLRPTLEHQRALAHGALTQRQEARTRQIRDMLRQIFHVLAILALGFAFVPGHWLGIEPGEPPARWHHRVIAALLLALLLVGLGTLLRGVSDVTSMATATLDPQAAILDTSFDLLERRLDEWAADENAALPLGPAIGAAGEEAQGRYLEQLLKSVQYLDLEPLVQVYQVLAIAHAVFGWLPNLVPLLITIFFFMSLGFVLQEIARMPRRAAAGEKGVIRAALGLALRTLWRELFSLVLLVGFVLFLIAQIQLAVRVLAHTGVLELVGGIEYVIQYLGKLSGRPDQLGMSLGLLALPVVVGAAFLLIAGATGAILLRARRLTQLRAHRGVPLRSHGRFWRKAGGAWMRLLWVPPVCVWSLHHILQHFMPLEAGAELGPLVWRSVVAALGALLLALLFGLPGDLRTLLRACFPRRGGIDAEPLLAGDAQALRESDVPSA
jgi:hypothetical protein